MIISYETFLAAQLLKKYEFEITFAKVQKIGELIESCGIDEVEAKIKNKRNQIKVKQVRQNLIKHI